MDTELKNNDSLYDNDKVNNNKIYSSGELNVVHKGEYNKLKPDNDDYVSNVNKLRERLTQDYKENPDDYYKTDIERAMKNDFCIRRFLRVHNQDLEKSYKQLIEQLKWRKEYGVDEFDPLCLPKELFHLGALFTYENDLEGRPCIYIRGKMHVPCKELEEYVKQYIVYQINNIDLRLLNEECWTLVLDASETHILNADFEVLWFIFTILKHYFPESVTGAYILGLPWIMQIFANFFTSLLPSEARKRVKFISKNDLTKHIAIENIPDFLGGSCEKIYRQVPRNALTAYALAEQKGIPRQVVEKSLKHLKKFLNDEPYELVDNENLYK